MASERHAPTQQADATQNAPLKVTRDDFFRDLRKVAKRKAPKEKPSRSGKGKR
jgi:hypothetical protein